MKKILLSLLSLVLLIAVIIVIWTKVGSHGGYCPQPSEKVLSHITISFTSEGVPACSYINSNGTVTWVNKTNKEVELATDPHPIHTGNKEISGGQFVLKLSPNEQKTVTLIKQGKFGFHDHMNDSVKGTIVVE